MVLLSCNSLVHLQQHISHEDCEQRKLAWGIFGEKISYFKRLISNDCYL